MSFKRRAAFLSLCAFPIVLTGSAQWNCDPSQNDALGVQPEHQAAPRLGLRSDGGLYVGWYSLVGGDYNLRLQRLDATGNKLWGPDGILVSSHPQSFYMDRWDLQVDSSDHALIVFPDQRFDPGRDVHAYRYDPLGQPTWGPDGVRISFTTDVDRAPKIRQLPNGRFALVWMRRPFASINAGSIRMQLLDLQGTTLLPPDGVALTSLVGGIEPHFPDLVPVAPASVLVAWNSDLTAPMIVQTQRFAETGVPEWNFPTTVLDDAASAALNGPLLAPDLFGGTWFAFNRVLPGGLGPALQRLDANGLELLPHDGLMLATDSYTGSSPDLVIDPATGSAMTFWVASSGSDVVVRGQRVGLTGTLEWGPTGIPLAPGNVHYKDGITCEPLGGGAIVGWTEFTPNGARLVAQRLDAQGQLLFGQEGVEFSTALAFKAALSATTRPDGTTLFLWEDTRDDAGDVYLQAVESQGGLGGPATTAYCMAQTDDVGCLPSMTWSGTASATAGGAFLLRAQNVASHRPGVLVYGPGAAQIPFGGGFLCVVPPLTKIALQTSGGTSAVEDCSGTFTADFAAWIQSGQDPALQAGVMLAAQWWYRSPGSSQGFGLTDGVQLYLCP